MTRSNPDRILPQPSPAGDRVQPDGPDAQTKAALRDLADTWSIAELVELAHYLTPAEQLTGRKRPR